MTTWLKTLTFWGLILLPNFIHAQDNVGYSYLGICHSSWPCELGIDVYKNKKKLFLSFLYDRTFGDDCSCIRQMYQDPRDKITRIHLINGPGLRNRRLQKEEIFFGYNISTAEEAIIKNDAVVKTKFEEVAKRAASDYQQTKGVNQLYVSTCLECNFSPRARLRLIEWAKPYFPEATFVDNPLFGSCLPDLICEKHGEDPNLAPPCIVDLDGKDFEKVNVPAFIENYKSCTATYLWGNKFNLIDPEQGFVEPRKRMAIPDAKYFASIVGLQ